jgi:hypothetical protein
MRIIVILPFCTACVNGTPARSSWNVMEWRYDVARTHVQRTVSTIPLVRGILGVNSHKFGDLTSQYFAELGKTYEYPMKKFREVCSTDVSDESANLQNKGKPGDSFINGRQGFFSRSFVKWIGVEFPSTSGIGDMISLVVNRMHSRQSSLISNRFTHRERKH